MKRIIIAASLLLSSSFAQAELVNGSTLSFTPIASGNYTSLPADGMGSWFAMELSAGMYSITPLTSLNGIVLGTTQLATSAPPVGNIDVPWMFFGNMGTDQTIADSNVLSASGDTATIDLSGWSVTWNAIPNINMGSGAWTGNAEGVADVVCETGSGCGNGSGYILDYSATVPLGDISGFGGVRYALHLEGAVSAVPVPAAAWLFGSGLLGLIGISRKKVHI